jgi:hypothetical protein
MNTKYIHHISHIHPFLMPTSSLWYPPQKRSIFSPVLHLKIFKLYIHSPRGFWLGTSGLNIYCALIKLTTPLLTLFLSPCSPNIQHVTVQYIILYSYIDGLFQYFSFSKNYIFK